MKGSFSAALVISVGILVGIGCAKSEEDIPDFGVDKDKTEPEKDADAGVKSKVVPSTDDDDADDDDTTAADDDDTVGDDDDDAGASSSSGGTTSSSGSSGTASSSSGGTTSGGSSPINDPCKVTTCSTAKSQASISGDTASTARSITGAASTFLTVEVTEDSSSWFTGYDLKLKGTLTSPPGKNFDLFFFVPQQSGIKECRLNEESSEKETGDDSISISWGEGADPNGSKDNRTITVEVREIVDASAPPAACDPTAKWTLKLEGNK